MKQTSDTTSSDRQQQLNETLGDLEMRLSALERYVVNNENILGSVQSASKTALANLQTENLAYSQRNNILEASLNNFFGEVQVVNQRLDQVMGESVAFNHRIGMIESQSVSFVAEMFNFSEKLDQLLREVSAFDFRLAAIEESQTTSTVRPTVSVPQFTELTDQCRQFAISLHDLQQQFATNLQNQSQQFAGKQEQFQFLCQKMDHFDEHLRSVGDRVQGFEQGLATVTAQLTKFVNADQVSTKFAQSDQACTEKFVNVAEQINSLSERFGSAISQNQVWEQKFSRLFTQLQLIDQKFATETSSFWPSVQQLMQRLEKMEDSMKVVDRQFNLALEAVRQNQEKYDRVVRLAAETDQTAKIALEETRKASELNRKEILDKTMKAAILTAKKEAIDAAREIVQQSESSLTSKFAFSGVSYQAAQPVQPLAVPQNVDKLYNNSCRVPVNDSFPPPAVFQVAQPIPPVFTGPSGQFLPCSGGFSFVEPAVSNRQPAQPAQSANTVVNCSFPEPAISYVTRQSAQPSVDPVTSAVCCQPVQPIFPVESALSAVVHQPVQSAADQRRVQPSVASQQYAQPAACDFGRFAGSAVSSAGFPHPASVCSGSGRSILTVSCQSQAVDPAVLKKTLVSDFSVRAVDPAVREENQIIQSSCSPRRFK